MRSALLDEGEISEFLTQSVALLTMLVTSLLHFRLIQALAINTIHIINKLRNSILYKVYQLLAHGRWVSPGTPASSTTKADRVQKT
jgi:hypothetical protein